VRRDPFEAILADRIGLDVASIGHDEVARAVRRRVEQTGCQDVGGYFARLLESDAEWEELAELVLVPETWFFREPTAFDLLAARAALHASSGSSRRFSVLSLPCATGEEPYSAAMTLLDVGLPPARFCVEALDVSRRAIDAAREATYDARSVKRAGPDRLQRFFEEVDGRWRVRGDVRRLVRFSTGNLVDPRLLIGAGPFDVVFCRNALIYLSGAARRQVLATLSRLVRADGVLLTGHAESLRLVEPAFESARVPRTFAWVRSTSGVGMAEPMHSGAHARSRSAHATGGLAVPSRTAGAAFDDRRVGSRPASLGAGPDSPGAAATGPATLLAQATRLADAGHLDQARAVAARLTGAWPGEAAGHYMAGVIASGLGRHAEAEAAFRRAVYLDPRHEQALLHLAFLRARRGDAGEANRLRRRAVMARTRAGSDGT
jgi:chemotaxis protein methyltransferase WspC